MSRTILSILVVAFCLRVNAAEPWGNGLPPFITIHAGDPSRLQQGDPECRKHYQDLEREIEKKMHSVAESRQKKKTYDKHRPTLGVRGGECMTWTYTGGADHLPQYMKPTAAPAAGPAGWSAPKQGGEARGWGGAPQPQPTAQPWNAPKGQNNPIPAPQKTWGVPAAPQNTGAPQQQGSIYTYTQPLSQQQLPPRPSFPPQPPQALAPNQAYTQTIVTVMGPPPGYHN